MVDFNKKLDRTNTYCTQWDYVEDRFNEKHLLPFTISDMDLEYPEEISKSLTKRLEHRVLGYSRWKHEDFRGSICGWYHRRFETEINSQWIYYSPSVIYSVSKCLELFSEEGDGVLLLTPSYNAFFDVVKNNNRKLVLSSLINNDSSYSIDFKDFENKCKKSKVFILCNPHNPVGKVWSENDLVKMVDICRKYNVHIISDDIHMDIDYHKKMTPILKITDTKDIHIVICSSPSKTFNTAALTGSYIIIPEEDIQQKFETITRYRDFVNSPAILSVLATITAYDECEYWVDELLEHLYRNLKFVKEYLEKNIPELTMKMPDGCYFAWIDFKKLNVSSKEFQDALIHVGKVAIMPGSTYGEDGEYYLRFNVGSSLDKVRDGLDRVYKTIQYLKNTR